MSTAPQPDRPMLLAGRTAAVEWASLLLRRAGREVRLLERAGEGVTVRAAWSEDGGGAAAAFASIADSVADLDAAALFVDFDDRAGWPDGALPEGLGCPAVVISAFGREPDAPMQAVYLRSQRHVVLSATDTEVSQDARGRNARHVSPSPLGQGRSSF